MTVVLTPFTDYEGYEMKRKSCIGIGRCICIFLLFASATQAADIMIEPASVTLDADDGSFAVEVEIVNSVDLGAFQFDIVYNPANVIISASGTTAGNVFEGIGNVVQLGPDIDNTTSTTPPAG